jgi:hydroxypyruvate isomerase
MYPQTRETPLYAEYSLKISTFSGDKSYSLCELSQSDRYVDYLQKSIVAAKRLDCNTLVIHSEWAQKLLQKF